MRHQNILVIGGSGFIGGHLAAALAADGRRVSIPSRRREAGKRLILLPTVDVIEADVGDDAVLDRLVRGKDAVVNLVGILHGDERTFDRIHVDLPRRIAAACRKAGVPRLLHMSALGAAPDGPSIYLRSKARGEAIVEDAEPLATTIFRPSVVFGPDDRFLNLFARLQKVFPVIPLGRTQARFQPVFVGDVAQAFARALDDPETFDRIYELAGPRVYTLEEIVQVAGALRAGGDGRPRPVLRLPDGLGRLQAAFLEHAPGPTLMSRDNFDSMKTDNVADGRYPGLAELGIRATGLEAEAARYLGGHSRRAHLDHLRQEADR